MNRIKRKLSAQIVYWKLISMFFIFRVLIKVAPPSKSQLEQMLVTLEELRARLEVE